MDILEYVDFELHFQRVGQGYRVRVECELAGENSSEEVQTYLTEDEIRQAMDNMGIHLSSDQQLLKATSNREIAARQFGQWLFEEALPSKVQILFHSALSSLRIKDTQGLRCKFYLNDVPELADLPWEFLYPSVEFDFLALSRRTPIVRYPDISIPVSPLKVTLPLQILAIVVRPMGYPVPNPDSEKEALNTALAPLIDKHQVQITWLVNPTKQKFLRQVIQKPYHALHFVGHGIFDSRTQDGFLSLVDEKEHEDRLDSVSLRRILATCPTLKLAVLIACEGARTGKVDPFASIAATLVLGGIPAVVAMQFPITYGPASTFSAALYRSLAEQWPVDTAVADGRLAMFVDHKDSVEWGIPVLYMRSPDGNIFDIAAALPPSHAPSPQLDELFRQALEFYYDCQMERARTLLEQIVAQDPGYPGAYEKLEIARQVVSLENETRLLQQAGRWKDMLSVLDHIRQLMPEYSDPHKYRAWAEKGRRNDLPNAVYQKGLEALLPREQTELSQKEGRDGLLHLADELAESERWETLHRLVAEGDDRQPWAEAHYEMEKSYNGYLTDLKLMWRHAEEEGQAQVKVDQIVTAIGAQARYAILANSIYHLLSQEKLWRYESQVQVVHTLAALAPALSDRVDLLTEIVYIACGIGDVENRREIPLQAREFQATSQGRTYSYDDAYSHVSWQYFSSWSICLILLIPSLAGSTNLLAQLLSAVTGVFDARRQAEILMVAARFLAGHRDLLDQALEIIQSGDADSYVNALIILAPSLIGEPDLLAEALKVARDIRETDQRVETLVALTPYLPDKMRQAALAEALDTVCHLRPFHYHNEYSNERTLPEALIALAPSLAGELDLLAQALEVAQSIDNADARARVLVTLVPHLPDKMRRETLAQVLEVTSKTTYSKVSILTALAPSLAGESDLLAEALKIAYGIYDAGRRAEVLVALTPHLPDKMRRETLSQVLAGVPDLQYEHPLDESTRNTLGSIDGSSLISKAEVLTAFAPSLAKESDLIAQAVEIAHSINDVGARAKVLTALMPYLPDKMRRETLTQLLVMVTDLGEEHRAEILTTLAPSLAGESDLTAEALKIAHSITDGGARTKVLGALTPHLPDKMRRETLAQVLAGVLDLTNDHRAKVLTNDHRAKVLTALAPLLAGESDLTDQAVEIAHSIYFRHERAEVLAALMPHLADDLQLERLIDGGSTGLPMLDRYLPLMIQALDNADRSYNSPDNRYPRDPKFDYLNPILATPFKSEPYAMAIKNPDIRERLYHHWSEAIRKACVLPRSQFLNIFFQKAPCLIALGGQQAAIEATRAILDAHRWWPSPEPQVSKEISRQA